MAIYPLEKFYIYFSPHTAHVIEIDGVLFPTLEHAYQCKKYINEKVIEEIKNARSPVEAWKVSSNYKHLQIPEFKKDEYKLKIMEELMRLKVQQHDDVKNALRESGEQQIVKHIVSYPPGDGFWDDGDDVKGFNHTGLLWMKIRDDIVFGNI